MNDVMISYEFLAGVVNNLMHAALEAAGSLDDLYWTYSYLTGSISGSAMMDLDEPVVTRVTEALHFQRGLHTYPVRAMEFNIPIPDDGQGNPDWTIVQEAWWLVQDMVGKNWGLFYVPFTVYRSNERS